MSKSKGDIPVSVSWRSVALNKRNATFIGDPCFRTYITEFSPIYVPGPNNCWIPLAAGVFPGKAIIPKYIRAPQNTLVVSAHFFQSHYSLRPYAKSGGGYIIQILHKNKTLGFLTVGRVSHFTLEPPSGSWADWKLVGSEAIPPYFVIGAVNSGVNDQAGKLPPAIIDKHIGFENYSPMSDFQVVAEILDNFHGLYRRLAVEEKNGCHFITISSRYRYVMKENISLDNPTNEITDKIQLTYNTIRGPGDMQNLHAFETPTIVNGKKRYMSQKQYARLNPMLNEFFLTEDSHIAFLVRLLGILDASLTAQELNMKIKYEGSSDGVTVLGLNSKRGMESYEIENINTIKLLRMKGAQSVLALAGAQGLLYLAGQDGKKVFTSGINWGWSSDVQFTLISDSSDDFDINYAACLNYLEPQTVAETIVEYVQSLQLATQYQIAESYYMLLLAYPEAPLSLPRPYHIHDWIGYIHYVSPALQPYHYYCDMFKFTIVKVWLASYVPHLLRMGFTFNSSRSIYYHAFSHSVYPPEFVHIPDFLKDNSHGTGPVIGKIISDVKEDIFKSYESWLEEKIDEPSKSPYYMTPPVISHVCSKNKFDFVDKSIT
ncbi:uncharacterized protein J8A68_004648 [[Candida] subhashii]|uniref:Uncharacterized protein n=1 Tax=[Candida] subhashii TaxID=561895 RepID=A0A8J5QJ02_9ASCO|nr:uncharacterized protein J8A68_004648 [[Candida] subhashii]KAG7661822.1 hypothetical protein J8A68_004648 [[Candida] subhashii]